MNRSPSPLVPNGHTLVLQELQPGGSVLWVPGIPVECLSSLQVWNPWQGAWERPKYLCKDRDALLCYDPETTYDPEPS